MMTERAIALTYVVACLASSVVAVECSLLEVWKFSPV